MNELFVPVIADGACFSARCLQGCGLIRFSKKQFSKFVWNLGSLRVLKKQKYIPYIKFVALRSGWNVSQGENGSCASSVPVPNRRCVWTQKWKPAACDWNTSWELRPRERSRGSYELFLCASQWKRRRGLSLLYFTFFLISSISPYEVSAFALWKRRCLTTCSIEAIFGSSLKGWEYGFSC